MLESVLKEYTMLKKLHRETADKPFVTIYK
jgi:hypothetical protein